MVRACLLVALVGCVDPPCEGSMLDGSGGLLVTPEEHPTGWGQADCLVCHATTATHRRDCTPGVDLAAVRSQVAVEGVASCAGCHGDGGVAP